ncbi:hypothetical protein QQP08_021121 [Theobroma cacao]|nr:hypothetical protein QQP08_021121 [Theobroma cacao]
MAIEGRELHHASFVKKAKGGWSYIFLLFVYDQKKLLALIILQQIAVVWTAREKGSSLSMPLSWAPLIYSFNHIHSKSIPKLSCHSPNNSTLLQLNQLFALCTCILLYLQRQEIS